MLLECLNKYPLYKVVAKRVSSLIIALVEINILKVQTMEKDIFIPNFFKFLLEVDWLIEADAYQELVTQSNFDSKSW